MPKIIHRMKFDIKGGAASPGAQLAPLSAKGIKAMEVCKNFNDQTKDKKGIPLRLKVNQFDDKSYEIIIKDTPVSKLLMEIANLKKGSSEPNRDKVATLTHEQIKTIATTKQKDTNAFLLESAIKTIKGTARSMGITVQ